MQVRERIEDRYELEELLGRGGFGEVWRAWDNRVGRWVAVKIGYPGTADDVRRLEREANLAGSLSHPNIATVHDVGRGLREGQDMVFLVMELVQGDTLATILRAGLPEVADVLEWAVHIADALGAAHRAGIVHRDVKPANVMVTESGVVKVLDFGIAKAQGGPAPALTNLTATGMIIGSFPYMAPERWTGGADGAPVDGRADLYALGCVLAELLTGRLPFTGGELHELLAQHLQVPPAAPSGLRPGIPAALDRLVLDLLAKDPRRRPADAEEVVRRLKDIAHALAAAPAGAAAGIPPATVANAPGLIPPRPSHLPTVQEAALDVHAPPDPAGDPIRLLLDRRLEQLVATRDDSPADYGDRLRMLAQDLTAELGPDDWLTVEATTLWAWAVRPERPDELERILPRMMRVFGVDHRETITARVVCVGVAAAYGPGDGLRFEGELREIIGQATRVLGASNSVTLAARYYLACASYRRSGVLDEVWARRTAEEAARQYALLAPLAPELLLADDDRGASDDLRYRVVHNAWLTGDFHTAAALYRQIYLNLDELAERGDEEVAYRVARSIGEAGDAEQALAMIQPLLQRVETAFGGSHWLTREVTETRRQFRKAVREQRRASGSGRSWGFSLR
ncbi:serine/threonine-protein kinase [Streptomyces goshikiensis]|uniref:serine/threonine-protein kinase n=1 Tax=Streptomyces goshikiensis TaxID=1942 RepID=UPI003692FB45